VVAVCLDAYAPVALWDAVVPFLSDYRRIWTGLGTVSFDLLLAVVITSSAIRLLGYPTWRAVHWLSYALGAVVLLHALGDGSDARAPWAVALLIAVGVGCAAGPLWRLAGRSFGGSSAQLGGRLVGATVVVAALMAIAGFAAAGPFGPGWALTAGTPPRLLGAAAAPATDDGHSLPPGLDDRLEGTRSATADGGVSVSLTDLRDPSILVRVSTSAAAPGWATVDLSRGGLSVCYGTPAVGPTVRIACGRASVTLTMTMQGGNVAGALITGGDDPHA
jgi:hypothetical protein